MPKQIIKIDQFHGGLSNSSDPRDILANELSEATDIMVDELGRIRSIGDTVAYLETLNNTGATVTEVPGAGLFQFDHDRTGAEDAGDDESERGDNYLALYDDADVQVWVYSNAVSDWDDDKDSVNNGVINFIGKSTSGVARPNFISIDGSIRVSTGEFSKYDSGTDINMGSHLTVTTTTLTVDDGTVFAVGNYIQIENEILFISAISTHDLTVTRSMFGTKDVQHDDDTDIYIVNMNQWYGYVNNNFFQTSAGVSEYTTNKWYNEVQHLRSLDELGISLALDDSSAASPDASALVGDKIIVAYWFSKDGFWNGSFFLGMTPVYLGGQEGPISDVGTDTIQLNEQILNVQLFICHPSITSTTVATHPLKDDRIVGLNLYTRSYTSDEWFLLKKFDLLEGGKHGWANYNSDVVGSGGDLTAGFWTDGSAALANPANMASYERTTADLTVTPGFAMGAGRKGIARVSGFEVSPLYSTVNLNSTSGQVTELTVVNPGPGDKKFVLEVLDENYDILYTTQIEKTITDSGASPPEYPEDGGYGSEFGGSS